ncbi:MAG: hypothetical protein ACHQUC_00705 [Chlamydiales bacterium]
MKNVLKDVLITLFGAVTSLLTALILYWIESRWNISFYSLMVWFVIPAGAGISGFAAASGYYFGARLFNHKPRITILLNMIVVSFGTYLLIQYLDYSFLETEGKSIAHYLSFWEYLDISMTNSSVQIRAGRGGIKIGSAIELKSFGYVYVLLQVIGFALGSFVLYLYLSTRLYCKECLCYFSSKGNVRRYMDNNESLADFIRKAFNLLEQHNLTEIISLHAEAGSLKCGLKRSHFKTDLYLKFCKGCRKHHLGLNVFKWNGKDDWDEIRDLSIMAMSMKELSFKD